MTDVPVLPPLEHLPEAVRALRNDRERLFCWHYMWGGGNGSKAARLAGLGSTAGSVRVRAHEMLMRQDILNAVGELGARYLYTLQPKALVKVGKLIDSKSDGVALKASLGVLGRTGMGERTGLDVNVSGEVTVDHTSAAVADLRRLRELGLPREKLVETFGFSGLARYEKLLEASDKAKVVEGEVMNERTV